MSLYKRAGSACYWYRFEINGREFRGSTRTRDRKQAQIEERRRRAIVEARAPDSRPSGSVDVAQLAELDISRAYAEGATKAHAYALESLWRALVRYYGARPIQQIDADSILAYVGSRRASGIRGQTIRKEVQSLRRGLLIAKRRGVIFEVPESPRIRSDAPHEGMRGRLHPPEIVAEWIAALPTDARDEVELALRTGLRSAELKRAAPSWVEPAPAGSATRYLLRVPAAAAKTRRERVVGITDDAFAIIRRRIEADPDAERILSQQTQRRWYRAACKAIGYSKRIHLRDLRHTFATLAVAGSGDPWAAMEALGHRDLRTTSIYQHSTEQRAAATALAAERLLESGTVKPAQSSSGVSCVRPSSRNVSGKLERATRLELATLSLGSETSPILEHVKACNYCQLAAADHLRLQANAPTIRHSDPAQSDPQPIALGTRRANDGA